MCACFRSLAHEHMCGGGGGGAGAGRNGVGWWVGWVGVCGCLVFCVALCCIALGYTCSCVRARVRVVSARARLLLHSVAYARTSVVVSVCLLLNTPGWFAGKPPFVSLNCDTYPNFFCARNSASYSDTVSTCGARRQCLMSTCPARRAAAVNFPAWNLPGSSSR